MASCRCELPEIQPFGSDFHNLVIRSIRVGGEAVRYGKRCQQPDLPILADNHHVVRCSHAVMQPQEPRRYSSSRPGARTLNQDFLDASRTGQWAIG